MYRYGVMAIPVQPSTLATSQPTRGSGLVISWDVYRYVSPCTGLIPLFFPLGAFPPWEKLGSLELSLLEVRSSTLVDFELCLRLHERAFRFGRGSGSRERFRLELASEGFGDRYMAGLGTHRAGPMPGPGRDMFTVPGTGVFTVPMDLEPSVPAAAVTDLDRGKGIATMYRRRGRSSTRDRAAPREMPEQAEPSARPEASAPPDLREQLAALTEVIKQQGVLLQRMCETVTQWSGGEPGASVQQTLWVEHGGISVQERTMALGQSQDKKRPFQDDSGQTSRRCPPRPPRSRSQGRGSSGRQRSRGSRQQGPSPRTLQCVICGGPHWPR
uniref:Uncharacterized protein n=1 Tax=Ananas comosus var. bracteatus TaxID=296719 RepID=A0A6V7PG98_ANACO|nr:unnamed protein product [Ananas comosus var. bracteatus]